MRHEIEGEFELGGLRKKTRIRVVENNLVGLKELGQKLKAL